MNDETLDILYETLDDLKEDEKLNDRAFKMQIICFVISVIINIYCKINV